MVCFVALYRSMYGCSLLELVVVVSLMSILMVITTPVIATYYKECSMKVAVCEICEMIKDARGLASASDNPVAVTFAPTTTVIALVSDRGADRKWNTSDDAVVRSFRLANKAGIRFGYGDCGASSRPGK